MPSSIVRLVERYACSQADPSVVAIRNVASHPDHKRLAVRPLGIGVIRVGPRDLTPQARSHTDRLLLRTGSPRCRASGSDDPGCRRPFERGHRSRPHSRSSQPRDHDSAAAVSGCARRTRLPRVAGRATADVSTNSALPVCGSHRKRQSRVRVGRAGGSSTGSCSTLSICRSSGLDRLCRYAPSGPLSSAMPQPRICGRYSKPASRLESPSMPSVRA